MKKLKSGTIRRIKRIRRERKSFKEIARILKISPATAHKYAKELNIVVKRKAVPRKRIKLPKNIHKSLIRILGHCMFDGSVFASNGNYVIRYTNSSEKEVENFVRDMWRVFRIKPTTFYRTQGKDIEWYEVAFLSKRIYEFLHNFATSFSTSKGAMFKGELITQLSKDLIIELLKTFWCDEGGISVNGKIVGKTKSLNLLYQLKCMHESLGLVVSLWKDRKSSNYALYIRKSKRNIKTFSKIGFAHGVVTRGKFKGLKE
jgi:hypothetical protein